MKKNLRKVPKISLLLAVMLLLASLTAVTALAEENGYWTTAIDGEGREVMVFTYTEPVKVEEYTPAGFTDAEPIAAVDNAQQHMAAGFAADQTAPAPDSNEPLLSLAVGGMFLLVLMGFALYKAI